MPYTEVMHKWKAGKLKSGGSGKPVKSKTQAIAIMMSEKRAAAGGKEEYQPGSVSSLMSRRPGSRIKNKKQQPRKARKQ